MRARPPARFPPRSSPRAADAATPFPRGGSRARPASQKQPKERDILFGSAPSKAKKRRKAAAPAPAAGASADDGVQTLVESVPTQAEPLTFRRLAPGLLSVCIVRAVTSDGSLQVSLPNHLNGLIRSTNLADDDDAEGGDEPQEYEYRIGDVLVAAVVSASKDGSSSRIELTARPSAVNAALSLERVCVGALLMGTVRSAEDHGFVVSLGVGGVTAFLPRDETEPGEPLAVGATRLFCVRKMRASARALTLSTSRDVLQRAVVTGADVSLRSLRPGMRVSAAVSRVLPDGLALRFLGFFHGTATLNHAPDAYREGQKVPARVLWVDFKTKTVGLTLARHLVELRAPAFALPVGATVERAAVARVDKGIGVVLSLPLPAGGDSDALAEPAFAHVSRLSDQRIEHVERRFKAGQTHAARVIGASLVDGMLSVSLQRSVLDQAVLRYSDVQPGALVSGRVLTVESWGMLVQLGEGVRALCPSMHLADVALRRPKQRIREGATVTCRVLTVDAEARKIQLTHKKTLVKSDAAPVVAYEGLRPKQLVLGVVTKIADFGVLVTFYNDVRGVLYKERLASAGVADPAEAYTVGQVLRCAVVSCRPSKRRLELTVDLTGAVAASADGADGAAAGAGEAKAQDDADAGSVVAGTVVGLSPDGVRVQIDGDEQGAEGVIPNDHLVDWPAPEAAAAVAPAGRRFERLVVLGGARRGGRRVLSAKPLLLAAPEAGALPASAAALEPGMQLVGFVRNVTDFGVFVEFLGGFSALAPRAHLADRFEADAGAVCAVGDSVRCAVQSVAADSGRVVVSLRSSVAASRSAGFLQSLLRQRAALAPPAPAPADKKCRVGKRVTGEVTGVRKGAGLEVAFNGGAQRGLVPGAFRRRDFPAGTPVKAVVLDFDAAEGSFVLSIDDAALAAAKHKSAGTEGQLARATVLWTAPGGLYAAALAPDAGGVALLQLADYNCPHAAAEPLEAGAEVDALVAAVGDEAMGAPFKGVPLLVRDRDPQQALKRSRAFDRPGSAAGAGAGSVAVADLVPGAEVPATVFRIGESRMDLRVPLRARRGGGGGASKQRVLVRVFERDAVRVGAGFAGFAEGQLVRARVLSVESSDAELRVTCSAAVPPPAVPAGVDDVPAPGAQAWGDLAEGDVVEAAVVSASRDGAWLRVAPGVAGFCPGIELSDDVAALNAPQSHLALRQVVRCRVTAVDAAAQRLALSVRRASGAGAKKAKKGRSNKSAKAVARDAEPGALVACRVLSRATGAQPFASVQVGPLATARVCVTELADRAAWADLPAGPEPGSYALCRLLDSARDASLRESRVAGGAGATAADDAPMMGDVAPGFVVGTSSRGCFVRLARGLDAMVQLKDLQDGFVKDPAAVFPPGRLVAGRVTGVDEESGRVRMSLRASAVVGDSGVQLSELSVGDVVEGAVTKVQPYGVFVQLDGSALKGLAHISEIADSYVEASALESMFQVGDRVKAMVKVVDGEKKRLGLGLKPSYFTGGAAGAGSGSGSESGSDGSDSDAGSESGSDGSDGSDEEEDEDARRVLEAMEASDSDDNGEDLSQLMASDAEDSSDEESDDESEDEDESDESDDDDQPDAQPVGFQFDDILGLGAAAAADGDQQADSSDESGSDEDSDDEGGAGGSRGRSSRRKRAERRRAEEALRERERQLAAGEAPLQTPDDFERALMGEPNSSLLWVKYMALQLANAEIDQARVVAERALKTISFREEQEKLNVWGAMLHLEHRFGSAESLAGMLQRALQANDAASVYRLAVNMHEKAGGLAEAETLLKGWTKKLSDTPEAWLRYERFCIEHGKHEQAARLLQRSLDSLPQREHVGAVSKLAQLEFDIGEPERARTMFENLLKLHPKRLDLWSVYVDKEVKAGEQARVRRLFDRAVHGSNWSSKKIRYIFQKYIDYERKHGDDESVAGVEQAALEYAERAVG